MNPTAAGSRVRVLHLFVSTRRSTWTCQCPWTNTPPASPTPAAPPAPPGRIPSSLTSPCPRNPACPDTRPSWPTADSNGADWPPYPAPLPGLHPQLWLRPSSRWTRCLPCTLLAGLPEARTPELPSSPPHSLTEEQGGRSLLTATTWPAKRWTKTLSLPPGGSGSGGRAALEREPT